MLAATHNGEWIPKVFVGVYTLLLQLSISFFWPLFVIQKMMVVGGAPLSRDEADDRPQTKRFWIGMYDAISR